MTADVPAGAPNPVAAAAAPFLAREKALSVVPRVPAAVEVTAPPGHFRVGSAPRLVAPQVVHGLVIAGVGVLLLAGLTVLGMARRRQSATLPT